jgi:hypothetical protein
MLLRALSPLPNLSLPQRLLQSPDRMKCLLLLAPLLVPALAPAQPAVHLGMHPHLFRLQKSAQLYSNLDTLTALPLQADSGLVVTVTATANDRWAFLSNLLNFSKASKWILISPAQGPLADFLVRRGALVLVPYEPLPSSPPKRRWWRL